MTKIKKEVSKEELHNYPISKYEGRIELIERPELIKKVVPDILKHDIIGFDTETKPSFRKGVIHEVSLVQIATYDCVYLFRIHKSGLTNELSKIFEKPEVKKIGIAIRDDIRDLNRIKKFEAKKMVDLNEVAKKLGFESIGAKKLSALLLGFRISKRQQTSNWEAHQLTPQQLDYAATDAWICLGIYEKLKSLYPEFKSWYK